jgi:hypothetical protein
MAHLRLPSSPEARAQVVARVLHAIASSDPSFDGEALVRALPTRFGDCSRALATGDRDRLRNCLTPALFEQWQKGDAFNHSAAAEPSETSVEDVRVVWAEHGPGEDRLVVGIDCLCQLGDTLHAPTDYWVLVRPAGARKPSGPPGECPDCGAPSSAEVTFCPYCGSSLGPLRGWLLEQTDDEIDWYEGPPLP